MLNQKLTPEQIVRLYNLIDTHHLIMEVRYLGKNRFKVITDKRRFCITYEEKFTNFILNGIYLRRDENDENKSKL